MYLVCEMYTVITDTHSKTYKEALGLSASEFVKPNLLLSFSQRGLSSVQLLSHVRLFVTPWTVARQAPLSITNSRSLLKLMSIESVMPSNHLILYHPLLLLPSVFPSISISSSESVFHIRWPKFWSFQLQLQFFQ